MIPQFLLYFLLPLWLAAGVSDYLCHRRTHIEQTSGMGEAVLHVLQAVEVGIPLLMGLFLEINGLVLLIMIAFVLAHTLSALWDGLYTTPKRYISPIEQHIHSHLEYIPIMAVSLVVLLHWEAFAALFGAADEGASFALRLKENPIPARYVLAVLGAIFVFQGALLFEETFRCWRAKHTQ
ncbi:MAG: diguanylate cyclase [Steroidobacteraceae bacterium]